MSYILEALKKAQAERQLGHAPDIHTPAAVPVPAAAAAVDRKLLLIGLGAGVVAAAAVAGIVWRANTPAAQPAVLARADVPVSPSAPPVTATVAAPAPASAAPPSPAVTEAPTLAVEPPAPPASKAPGASAPPAPPPAVRPVETPRTATPKPAPAPAPASARDAVPEAVYLPAPTPQRTPEPAPVRAPEPAPEENLRTLQQLPEAIQREVPKVAVGGYIYSPNPADRLLLIDKTLRREGEEVAPGLVLERLMPKYAVMNYRGTRYRVGY
ncbi:general secretion pathway protein GspB [Massilia sp. Leaf139]|uniref:general secretion pathway protein GspB n=1 Tax=Massilia sp. Leaf139 TaxID=1736272 RepID=UPI0006F22CE3|nr:general secretion pathway protein GspB [Massilia sp. Leaf139]KQQ86800.1 hypothetical protein ASF77_19080 [Massilia sp. Leaf139]